LNNKEWMSKKYEDEFLSTYQIAEECNCSVKLVWNQLKKFGIEIRSLSESQNPNAKWDLLNNKDWMSKKYEDELLNTYQIAEECNCSDKLVGSQLKKFGIEIRSNNESKNPNAKWELLNNKEWMSKKYEDELLSTYQIAKECNCGQSLVMSQLKKSGIDRRNLKGENNPQWKGGISFAPYCPKFNKSKKEEIREKFDRVCFLCGKLEEENNCKLSVHHVNYNKGQGCGHSWSLIPLCSSCHVKTNSNRHYWFNLLNNYWLYCKEIHFLNLDLFISE